MINFSELCIERPLGTKGNTAVIDLLSRSFIELEYKTIELPIDCTVWQSDTSFLEQNGHKITIFPSPFSKELKGNYPVKYVSTINELQDIKDFNGVLIFHDELSKKSIMSKDFPFYFPDDDKLMYETLEKINPKGIIAITGQDPASGLNPFPIFYDANFGISTAYVSSLDNISADNSITIEINSKTVKEKSKQLVFRKEGLLKDVVLVAAHMDSKYFTNGAIDNAAGVFALYEIAKLLKGKQYKYTIEIVPFNGEESPEVSGQLAYLSYLQQNNYKVNTMINIDGVGHIGSKNTASFFNFDDKTKNEVIAKNDLLEGEQWYSGDHSMFAFQEVPCIAVTSSDLFTDAIKLIHTKKDVIEAVDIDLLKTLSKSIVNIIERINEKT